METEFFKDNELESCPCLNCIVRSMCKSACFEELIWFESLTSVQRNMYSRAKLFKKNISREANELFDVYCKEKKRWSFKTTKG